MVKAGQVVALMDTRDLAGLAQEGRGAGASRRSGRSTRPTQISTSSRPQVMLAQQEFDRASALVPKGYATTELLDQRQQQMDAALAALNAATARVGEAEHALDAATPRRRALPGQHRRQHARRAARRPHRIPRRQCRRGAAGGRQGLHHARHLLRLHGHLSADRGGRPGQDRLRRPHRARCLSRRTRSRPRWRSSPAQAQFTPKTVETKDERDKLMFRIRVRIDPERLRTRAEAVRSGLPGVAYVRTDPAVAWPPAVCKASPPP